MVEQFGLAMMLRCRYSGNRLRIHLGHDQRDVGLVAKLRRVVDDDASGRAGPGRVLTGNAAARRKQADIDARKSNFARSRTGAPCPAKLTVLPTERSLASGISSLTGNLRSSRICEHGFADEAGGADDGYAIGVLAGHGLNTLDRSLGP